MQVVFDNNDHYDFLTRKNYLYITEVRPALCSKKKKYNNDMDKSKCITLDNILFLLKS